MAHDESSGTPAREACWRRRLGEQHLRSSSGVSLPEIGVKEPALRRCGATGRRASSEASRFNVHVRAPPRPCLSDPPALCEQVFDSRQGCGRVVIALRRRALGVRSCAVHPSAKGSTGTRSRRSANASRMCQPPGQRSPPALRRRVPVNPGRRAGDSRSARAEAGAQAGLVGGEASAPRFRYFHPSPGQSAEK